MQAIYDNHIIIFIAITLLIIGLLVYIVILHRKIHEARRALKRISDRKV